MLRGRLTRAGSRVRLAVVGVASPGRDPAASTTRAVHALVERAAGEALPVRLWNGEQLGAADASFRVVLHHPWSLRALLVPPSDMAAGEAYVRGAIDVEGGMADALGATTAALSALSLADRARIARLLLALPAPPRTDTQRRAHLRGIRHSPARDRAAIQFHYDLPLSFYESFLDPALVYSCAYFATPDEDLATAQRRKLDLICRKLSLRPGERLLDVGCGYGALLIHAATCYGVSGVGVTLSQVQFDESSKRVAEAGVADRVQILQADYRELPGSTPVFDKAASVGMFEHVGPARLGEYFATMRRLLRPGGLFCNHGIVTAHADAGRRRRPTFISTYVFPDGELVPAWRAVREIERGGFELVDAEQLRPHYALTLGHWVANLERNHGAAVAAASEADYRIWRAYMAGSAQAFTRGALGVVQILGARRPTGPGGAATYPLTRARLAGVEAG